MKQNFTRVLSISLSMKSLVLSVFLLAGFRNTCFAQPTVLGTDIVAGPPAYVTYDLNTVGGFKQVRIQALNPAVSGTIKWEFCQGTAASPNYTDNWRPYTAGLTLSSYNAHIPPVGGTASALYNGGSGGQGGFLPAVTANNYYTFNISNNAPTGNNNMAVLETSYNPETITLVTRTPATVGAVVSPTITVTMSSAPVSNVYVRYSTNAGFATSTIVPLSFVGATGTATIPVQASGATVYYYVYSSTRTKAAIDADVVTYGQGVHDMATLNVNNNGGLNYSYTVLPVTVNATNAANDASYSTLAAAFAAINAATHTGVITVTIGGNTTEVSSAVLNGGAYTSVTVRPSGFRTVSGNLAAPLVDLNGADNVTIDGLNDGTNTLTFTNPNTGGAGTSTIRVYNNAITNTIQNCNIEGSTLSTTDGVVTLGSGTNATLSISNNNIRAAGANLPIYSIYSSGTNTAVTVSNNFIENYFSATVNSAGIYANTACNTWVISSNRFYQTASRTITGSAINARAIWVTAGGGHTISGNTIGFATNGGGGFTIYTTTNTDNQIIPIELAGNATASSIQGNTIAGFTITSASNLTNTTAAGIFSGIYVSSGSANIGTNTIGAATGTGSVSITCSVTATQLFITGIYVASAAPNTVNIQNNNIGSINLIAATVAVQYLFNGINVPLVTANYSITDNVIGSTSAANSVAIGTSSTSATSFMGIVSSTSGTLTVAGNIIQNCTVSGTGASSLTGIVVLFATGVLSITNNSIISCSLAGTGALEAIRNAAAATTLNISGNIIRSNTISSGTAAFAGISNSGAVTSVINITNNQLGNASGGLVTFSIANNSNLYGIYNSGGTSAAALTIQSNDFRGITNTAPGTGSHFYIFNNAATLSQNINTNTFTTLSINTTTGGVTFISNSVSLGATGTKIIKDNAIITSFVKTGAGTNLYFYNDAGSSVAGATITNEGNNFSNVTINGAITCQGWFNTDGSGTVPVKNVFNNTFSNITANTSAVFPIQITNGTSGIYGNTITGCSAPNTVTALTVTAGSFNIYSNTINTLSSSTSFAGVTGISISGGTTQSVYYNTIHTLSSSATSSVVSAVTVSSGTTVNVYKNKIYNLSSSAALSSGGVYGISVTGGTTVSLYNNLVGLLTANAATFDDALRGISLGGASGTVNVYYNTVYLAATTGGTNFGSSALYANTGPTVNLRNNIFYNISTPFGSGRTIAYRRNGTSLANYAATSNNNLFYAGPAVAPRVIFYDGTTAYATLAGYQGIAGLAPRDNVSVSVSLLTNFVSLTGSSLNFLHLNGSSAAESGGANIATFTDDYDDEIRQGNAGYTATGTAPDIGADEFESVICPATPTITSISAGPYYAGDPITITGTNLSGIAYATMNGIDAAIGATTATTAVLTIPVTLTDSIGLIQVAYTSACTYSTINANSTFVFAGFITNGGQGAVNWGTNTIWRNNALPVANAPAIINTGDNVTLNVAADPIKFTILASASLIHQNNTLVFGNTFLNNTTVSGTLTIDNSGAPVLLTPSRFISPKLMINSGGTFTNNSANAAAVTIANFYVYAGATYNHNAVGSSATGVINDFPGSTLRSYGNTSNVVVTKWANSTTVAPSTGLPASGSPGWGNLTINVASLGGSWNQTGALTNVQGNLNIVATGGSVLGVPNEFRLTGTTATLLTIGGSLNISGGGFVGNTGSASPTITVAVDLNITGGYFLPCNSSGTTCTVNVTGNTVLNGGHIVGAGSSRTYVMTMATLTVTGSSVFGLSQSSSSALTLTTGSITISGTATMYSSSSGNITINCPGNFSSTSTGGAALVVVPVVLPGAAPQAYAFALQNSSSAGKTYNFNLGGNFSVTGSGTFGGGSASSAANINFTGGAAAVTYTAAPSVMSVISTNKKNNFVVTSGKTLTLNNSIIPASTSSSNSWTFTVNTGATLDFGTHSVGDPALSNRVFVFTAQTGSTLRTAHTGGILNWLAAGGASITTLPHNASLSDGATYVFNGTLAQASSIFRTTPTASPYNAANIIINNALGVTLDTSYNVTAALQMQTGNLTLGVNNLTTAIITGAPFSNAKMVVTNSTGSLGQPVALATILYPVGNGGNYTPASYNFTANSTARYLNVRAVTPRNSNDGSSTDYINNRWWNTTLSVATGTYAYTSVYTYINGDMVGTAANIRLNRWTGSAWVNDAASVVNNTNFTITSGALNETTGTLAATAEWVGRVYAAPAVYTWTNPVTGSWLDPTKWTPTGVPGSGDGVIFDKVGSYNVFSMPVGITLTQMHNTGSTLNLRASAAGTVNISTVGAAPQFRVSAGASTTLDSLNAVNINLVASATGNVGGSLNLQRTTHKVTVTTAGALVVPSGGYFSYGSTPNPGFGGNPFGGTGTNGSVLFQSGSICECFEGSNPFGSTITDNIVTFQTNSLFRYSDPNVSSPSVSGRTYSNFTYNVSKVTSIAAANSFICDSLIVTLGTFNLNLQGTPTPDHAIRGNINVLSGATLTFSPSVSGTVNLNSGATQIIWGAGTLSVNANAIMDINAGTTASLQKNMEVNSTGRMNVNGNLICNGENYINNVTAGGLVQLNNTGSIFMQSINGINTSGTSGNIRTTNFGYTGTGGNFIYSGTANQVTGNRLPPTLGGTSELTIANTGTAPNNIVTLTTNNTTTPRINLNAGQFNAGTGGTLIINGGTNLVVDGGGDQYLSGGANDNIIRFATNGAVSGTPELWNVTIGTSGTGVDFQANARINGILLINTGGFVVNNAPRYNTGSYLIYNTGGSYNRNIEWSNNSGLGNPAYPHHVTVQNGTTVDVQNPAFDLGCGGNLNLGAATAGTLVLSGYTQPYDLYVAGNINIGSTAAGTLTMSNSVGCDLYLTGNWVRNAVGTVNFGGGNGRSVYFEGSTDATITATGGQYFPYVRMQKTAKAAKVTLADHVSIGFEATFTRGTLDLGTNNKFFSLLSNANYDARVDVSDSTNTAFVYGADDINGQFIVHRYFPARRAWRLVNAPFKRTGGGTHSISQAWQEQGNGNSFNGFDFTASGWVASVASDTSGNASGGDYATQITGGSRANGFDSGLLNNPSIKYFAGAGTWNAPTNTHSTNVNSQEGWLLFVRGDRVKYGEINTNAKAPTITSLRPRGQIFIGQKTITASGMQTVGNPYASAVDYFTMTRAGAGWPANPTYYVWDPYLGGSAGVGAFVTLTWNGTNFTRISTGYGTGNYDNRYIPSGAAIMVDFPAGGGTLSMNEANKNTDSNTTAFRPVRQLTTLLQTKDVDNSFFTVDGALSLFENSFNTEADVNDARKLGNVNENFGLQRKGNILSVERMKLTGDGDTVFYFMNKMQRKNYQLQFNMEDMQLPASTEAFLEDIYLKKKTPVALQGITETAFAITADAGSSATDRFRLVFRKSVRYTFVHAIADGNNVAVNWNVSDELNIEKYEIERSADGTHFSTVDTKISNGESHVPVSYSGLDEGLAPGEYYYRIKSISSNGAVVYSNVVQVRVIKGSPGLFVFPNPVTNSTIQLQLNKAAAGVYATTLFGNNGQVINNEIINHAGGTATTIITPKQRLVNGTYQLKITRPDGSTEVIKIVVVNE